MSYEARGHRLLYKQRVLSKSQEVFPCDGESIMDAWKIEVGAMEYFMRIIDNFLGLDGERPG